MRYLALALLALAIGCHSSAGQQPPSPPPSVALSWTAPSSCSASAPCVYAISRAAATGTTCPATTGTTYALVTTTASQVTTASDSPAGGASYCYIAQTQQGSPVLTSVPSNSVLVAVPTLPAAPNALGGTSTAELAPEKLQSMPEPTIAKNEPIKLAVKFVGRQ